MLINGQLTDFGVSAGVCAVALLGATLFECVVRLSRKGLADGRAAVWERRDREASTSVMVEFDRGEHNVSATPDPVHTIRRRHRVVAIGSGLGGLTATKGLKHAQINIADALVFLTRITAQGTSHVVNQTSLWVQIIPVTAAVATTVGALITLSVAVVAELNKRVAAQARFWWTARIENATSAITTILAVDANATAAKASEAPDGYRQVPMRAGADDIVTTARNPICHKRLPRLPRTSKGWS